MAGLTLATSLLHAVGDAGAAGQGSRGGDGPAPAAEGLAGRFEVV